VSDDTAPATVTLLSLERVNAGRLVALAAVEIVVGGIAIEVHGVRVIRQLSMLVAEAPKYRRGAEWLPAVGLPPELRQAIADMVLDAFKEQRASPIVEMPGCPAAARA
jgi:hypothetical protein